jgi:hypothetical protein
LKTNVRNYRREYIIYNSMRNAISNRINALENKCEKLSVAS